MTWTVTGSQAEAVNASTTLAMASTVSFLPVESNRYRISFAVASYAGGSVQPVFGSALVGSEIKTSGVFEFDVTANAAQALSKVHGVKGSALTADIDNFQIFSLADSDWTYNYTYQGSDVPIYAVLFNLKFQEIRQTGLALSNEDQSIPVQQETDRVFSNP